MSLTLREQLSNLPVPRLTTVLRVNFSLPDGEPAFQSASKVVEDWWNEKAGPYDIGIEGETVDLSFSRGLFKAEFARTDQSFALAMEEPDSSIDGRSWIVELALKRVDDRSDFGLRASYRQPYNANFYPEPRAPRFLRQIVDDVGAIDHWSLKSSSQLIDHDNIPFFMDFVESPSRALPIVAISEDIQTGMPYVDVERIARLLAGSCHIFRLDLNASWDLSRLWGNEWSVFLGAVRCYNPGFNRAEDKLRHRLWLAQTIGRFDANYRNGFTNALINHVFTQDTASFEAFPLLTPSVVRRQIEEAKVRPNHFAAPIIAAPEVLPPVEVIPSASATSPVVLPAPKEARSTEKFAELEETYRELLKRLQRQEEIAVKLETDLEQERAGRAETERRLLETEAELKMFTEENVQLEQQKALAFGDVSKEGSETLRPLWQNFSEFTKVLQNVATKFRRLEEDSESLDHLKHELEIANQTLLNNKATIESLNRRSSSPESDLNSKLVSRDELIAILPGIAKKQVSLASLLEVIALIFPDRITILESAFQSAKDSGAFQYGDQAFDLLCRLATTYWTAIQFSGDSEARKVFGKSYASNEGSGLSKAGRERRTFIYNQEPILMEKHLKIGTADNPAETLRIHFEWIGAEKRILVGHCGRHLNF